MPAPMSGVEEQEDSSAELDEFGEISVLEDAFVRAKLPSYPSEACPLGNLGWDHYIHRVLNLAGITVEILNRPSRDDDCELHSSVQIGTLDEVRHGAASSSSSSSTS